MSSELIGSLIDSLIMFGAGVFFAFGYPRMVSKRVAEGAASEGEVARVRWMQIGGYVLMVIAVILFLA